MVFRFTAPSAEHQVRQVLSRWAEATRTVCRDEVRAILAANAVIFDGLAPMMHAGVDADGKSGSERPPRTKGRATFQLHEMSVSAGYDVAFAHGLVRCRGTRDDGKRFVHWVRATFCLLKLDGEWTIAHRHLSIPPTIAKPARQKAGHEALPPTTSIERGGSMQVQPYLFFNGRCEEAIDFYQQALGAKVEMLMRFKDSPEAPPPGTIPPGSENKVMHAALQVGGTIVMASDGACSGKPVFQGFSLSISVKSEVDARRLFAALSDGGQVQMPLGKTFWSPLFGMAADRFGVGWMINVVE